MTRTIRSAAVLMLVLGLWLITTVRTAEAQSNPNDPCQPFTATESIHRNWEFDCSENCHTQAGTRLDWTDSECIGSAKYLAVEVTLCPGFNGTPELELYKPGWPWLWKTITCTAVPGQARTFRCETECLGEECWPSFSILKIPNGACIETARWFSGCCICDPAWADPCA